MRVLIEISGENKELAVREVQAILESCGSGGLDPDGTDLVVAAEGPDDLPAILAGRLGLAHSIGEHLFSCEAELSAIVEHFEGVNLPPGTFAIDARRKEGHTLVDSMEAKKASAKALSGANKVDLRHPDNLVALILARRVHAFLVLANVDRKAQDSRKVAERPFFSPISLHPKFARALVNLSRPPAGGRLLDPFCGTGGLLIEAGLMGFRVLGSDVAGDMVEGCRANLAHFGVESADLRKLDVASISEFGRVDAIATDPPYGRSTTTMGEELDALYSRMFEACADLLSPGSHMSVVLPLPEHVAIGEQFMELRDCVKVKVHGTLDRHFCAFRKK